MHYTYFYVWQKFMLKEGRCFGYDGISLAKYLMQVVKSLRINIYLLKKLLL